MARNFDALVEKISCTKISPANMAALFTLDSAFENISR
jgi:hypothetical protein